MSMIFSIANFKGGVGKTTTAISLASGLYKKGYRVLIIDTDPQQNTNFSFGVLGDPEPSLFELYAGIAGKPGYKEIPTREAIFTFEDKAHLLPSSRLLDSLDADFSSVTSKEFMLDDILASVRDIYDVIVIDCPPALGLLTKNAITVSDYVIIPCTLEFLPVKGILSFIERIGAYVAKLRLQKKPKVAGILLNQFNTNPILSRDLLASLQDDFNGLVFDTCIRKNIALSEAQLKGMSIFDYAPESNGAKDFESFTTEIETNFINHD